MLISQTASSSTRGRFQYWHTDGNNPQRHLFSDGHLSCWRHVASLQAFLQRYVAALFVQTYYQRGTEKNCTSNISDLLVTRRPLLESSTTPHYILQSDCMTRTSETLQTSSHVWSHQILFISMVSRISHHMVHDGSEEQVNRPFRQISTWLNLHLMHIRFVQRRRCTRTKLIRNMNLTYISVIRTTWNGSFKNYIWHVLWVLYFWPESHLLPWRGQGSRPLLQPATRGRLRSFDSPLRSW